MRDVLRSSAAQLAAAGCISSDREAELAIRRLTAADGRDPDGILSAAELLAVDDYIERRRNGDPPHYILGGCEFMGRWIRLDETAYIPRPWTETLVLRGVATLKRARRPRIAVDLGTGSGAIARILAERVNDCHVWALEVDEAALRWARMNTAEAKNVTVLESDLFDALPAPLAGRVDLVIGSLPYVPSGELAALPRDYREHEPMTALDGGRDCLGVDLRALRDALAWLRPGGRVLLELGHRQGNPLVGEALQLGYRDARAQLDDEGDDLFLEGRR
ncbi:MAG TPA: HemK/PrmC family methyltransferase [Candidatus Dormibacteraeota bacterium]|nr:HemK/PrmC family methyltransferase [Candidatus Dormibacteraeota bacterium]